MRGLRRLFLLAAALASAPVASVRKAEAPETMLLGRDGTGEPCAAAANWHDPRRGDIFDHSWTITCRGVSASRPVGWVLELRRAAANAVDPKQCATPATRSIDGLGEVQARNCFDPTLDSAAVTVMFDRHGRTYLGAALPTALGPLEVALRAATLVAPPPKSRDAEIKPTLKIADLAAAPAGTVAATEAAVEFDADTALQTGIALNHRSYYVEASRLLNDALSRFNDTTPPLVRAELELEAALADSNISQLDAADDHFARARTLLASAKGGDRLAFLQAKQATYRGMDRLNRRLWSEAVTQLINRQAAASPLEDPSVLSRLNQATPPRKTAAHATGLSATSGAELSRLLLETQRNWSLSVAYLALNRDADSESALKAAQRDLADLQRSVDPGTIAPLKSRIQRQFGRIAAHQDHIDAAIAYFDCAIGTLHGQATSPQGCVLDAPATTRPRTAANSAIDGPVLAETELERASLLARKPGLSPDIQLAAFSEGVDGLISTGATGAGVPAALESYLDLLAKLNADKPSERYADAFFRAIQAIGQPAIARQVAQLRNIVSGVGGIGAKVRDRDELERQVVRLRYAISTADPNDKAGTASLEKDRAQAESALIAINQQIAADPRFRTVDDQPATVAELRKGLLPDEAYLKVVTLRSSAYGIVIDKETAYIYRLPAPAATTTAIARKVRASIRDETGNLPYFDVPASYTLFRLIAGPAQPALLAAKRIVVDPSGPLENLPAGILVTDEASMKAYLAHFKATPYDYSAVSFLAEHAELSNALSPRAFLISRTTPPSRAPHPFIGLGENAPPEQLPPAQMERRVSFGTGCDISYGDLSAIMTANRPVSAREIGIAATALGVPQAPEVTGRVFSDIQVEKASERGDLLQYQVLHFATHGLPETHFRCSVLPPALVTTLDPPTATGPQSDGLLSFSEIAQLRLDANLVVLSACETAAGVSSLGGRLAGQDESSQTLDGLVRAFVTANARAVLATYWKVPDRPETDEFIRDFYAHGRTDDIGAALRTAQTEMIQTKIASHPYFWGAYFLVGDASKTMISAAGPRPTVTASR